MLFSVQGYTQFDAHVGTLQLSVMNTALLCY